MKSKRILSIFMTLLLLVALVPAYAFASWQSQASTAGNDEDITGVAFGVNKFVAVTGNGNILKATDGATWSGSTYDSNAYFTAFSYGGPKFVAFATIYANNEPSSNLVITSSNGLSWSQKSVTGTDLALDPNVSVNSVKYGSSNFVAVGSAGLIVTSTDGEAWTQIDHSNAANNTKELNGIGYGNNTFVAVGATGTILTSSDNGANWTARISGTSSALTGVSYGGGTFVAVGAGGVILTSTDGATWTSRTSGATANLSDVAYGNGTFTAVGASGTVLASADGTSWSTNTSGTSNYLYSVTYGTAGFVIAGEKGTVLLGTPTLATPTPTPTTTATATPTPTPTPTTGPTATPTPGPVLPISLDATKYTLVVNGTHTTIVYDNKEDNSSTVIAANKVTFTSSNTTVATVDASGVVTGKTKGTATISAYYAAGNNTRYVTVTVDASAKPPVYLTADNVKTGAVTLSVYGPGNVPVNNAVVKISAGAQVYPLLNTDSAGKVQAYVPAGTYSIVAYSVNGTTLKNYTFKSLKVVAGQASSPLVQPQFTAGSIALAVDTVKGEDKKITGTTAAGATVTARDGATILGTAKADTKLGKFSITLKTPQPGKTIIVTAVDADENEKSATVTVPLVAAVKFTPATKGNDVEHDIAITFVDKVNLLTSTSTVTSVTYNGTQLTKTDQYTLAAGKLTIKAGVIQAAGSHTIVVKSSAYEDAQITQTVVGGAADASKSSYALDGTPAVGGTVTATVTVRDQYGNISAGKTIYADITVTSSTKTTVEKYTIAGVAAATSKNKVVGKITDANGTTSIAIAIPATVDTGDGISIQFKVGATAAKASAVGNPITFTK